ncbi:hypothetical protein RRG08_060912 [Elysia crispata]|uniref:Uncharacterized protein n=1 Tax=Elysia crispata TaxID=231223 RepID=A0AAE1D8N3_9GAST|nr:hypothetical protein RRG08_060912 [Elysia crispata]
MTQITKFITRVCQHEDGLGLQASVLKRPRNTISHKSQSHPVRVTLREEEADVNCANCHSRVQHQQLVSYTVNKPVVSLEH